MSKLSCCGKMKSQHCADRTAIDNRTALATALHRSRTMPLPEVSAGHAAGSWTGHAPHAKLPKHTYLLLADSRH